MKDDYFLSQFSPNDRKTIDCYSKQLIKNCFDYTSNTKVRKETFITTMRPFMPYCLHKINDDTFLPLNRDYKPLGMPAGHHYIYESYDFLFLKKHEINLDILWDNGYGFGGYGYFFYSDSCTPYESFNRYLEILQVSIFLEKTRKKFTDFWGYKFPFDKEGWKRNEWKTVETRTI